MNTYVNYGGILLPVSANHEAQFWGGAGSEPLKGGAGHDLLSGGGQGHVMAGGAGDDTYRVKNQPHHQRDTVVELPGGGTDTVIVLGTRFELPENLENLTLVGASTGVGNSAANLIVGDEGSQVIVGSKGDDLLLGGGGADIFVFRKGDGRDIIADFDHKSDKIRLDDFGLSDFQSVKASALQQGDDTVIRLPAGDILLLKSVQVESLTAENFQLELDRVGLSLTFEENFDSLNLFSDATKQGTWKTSFAYGTDFQKHTHTQNNEKQVYVDPEFRGSGKAELGLNPFSIENGVLTVSAERLPESAQSSLWDFEFSSGLLTTEKSFSQLYGYFEIRAEVETQKGMWPAFWLKAADGTWPPELDVFEQVGGDVIYQTAHTAQTGAHSYAQTASYVPDISTGFHTYGMLWTPQQIVWFVDGVEVGALETPSDLNKPMYMLVNLAVGGNWPGDPDENFQSGEFKVDYIKVYSVDPAAQRGPVSADPKHLVGNDAADDFRGGAGADTMQGAGGNDTLSGGLGDDVLLGNAEQDWLHGGDGNDQLFGGRGGDRLFGGGGGDYQLGDLGADQIFGEAGSDTLSGGDDNDLVDGGGDRDHVFGGNGDDTLDGGLEIDLVAGDDGNDVITNRGGSDLIFGGAGNDTIRAGSDGDALLGNTGDDLLFGGSGTDRLWGGQGADALFGDAGDDELFGDRGNDRLIGGAGSDQLTGGEGRDRFVFRELADSRRGDADWIIDFTSSEDLIDVSGIDADPSIAGDQAFIFVAAFDGLGGRATLAYDVGENRTLASFDVNGDKVADFELLVNGQVDSTSGWIV